MSCASATACTAVGLYLNGTSVQPTLAEAWNGTSWSVQPMPKLNLGGSLNGVSCTSATLCTSASACTAVVSSFYRTVTVAWNGTSWSLEHPPAPGGAHRILGDVSCVPAGGCTAVGNSGGLTLADAKP